MNVAVLIQPTSEITGWRCVKAECVEESMILATGIMEQRLQN